MQMTKNFKQLSLEQRYKIESLLIEGFNQSQIAKHLGDHKSTISRELSRNVPKRRKGVKVYDAFKADQKIAQRHSSKNKAVHHNEELKA
jgi:transposase, IS30 family